MAIPSQNTTSWDNVYDVPAIKAAMERAGFFGDVLMFGLTWDGFDASRDKRARTVEVLYAEVRSFVIVVQL